MDSGPSTAPTSEADDRTVRVLVADGDALARKALRDALSEAGLSVVGQAADASHAVGLVNRCAPDVVVVDAALPPDGGVDAMQALSVALPGVLVIILAGDDNPVDALHALSRGAAGYLTRELDLSSLARAVEGAMTGEAAISRSLAGALIEYVREVTEKRPGMRPVKSPLTTREWEVMDFLRMGASTAEIAKELVVSPETVHSHVQHILRKLHAHSRAEAVEIAEQSLSQPDASA